MKLFTFVFLLAAVGCADDAAKSATSDAGTVDATIDMPADVSSDSADAGTDDDGGIADTGIPAPAYRLADTRPHFDIDGVGDELLVAASDVVRNSPDRGRTWFEAMIPGVTRVRALPSGERFVWTFENAIYLLNDNVWTPSYGGLTTHRIIDIIGDTSTGRLYFIAQSKDAFRRPHFIESSADGGVTWIREAEWQAGIPIAAFETSTGVRLLSSGGELGEIAEGTVTFTQSVPYNSFTDTIEEGASIDDVLFVTVEQGFSDTEQRTMLYRSDDLGASWRIVWEDLGPDPRTRGFWGQSADDLYFLSEKKWPGATSVIHLRDTVPETLFVADGLSGIGGLGNPDETLLVGDQGLYISW